MESPIRSKDDFDNKKRIKPQYEDLNKSKRRISGYCAAVQLDLRKNRKVVMEPHNPVANA
ncbi:MAG: hypothetical protein CM15mP49_20280 [Actinomycetota bacterium]|nr:MAG: hypothetical protein CM15mP49_20280 [Actinomycetota bacterium]